MVRILFRLFPVFLFITLWSVSVPPFSHAKTLFKVATLAPEGSVWVKRFREFTREVEGKSNGEVTFKVYPGGVMGDDRAMFRKMQVGQLHGGGFTMSGIGPVVPDFRIMGLPFLFESYEEVDKVWQGLTPSFNKVFAEKNFEFVASTEVGFVYTMSMLPIATLESLRKCRCWAPDGDPVSALFLETLGVSSISLAIPDVLTSLQTGLIDTVFNSFYGSIVLQWFTKAKYISDIPFGYAYGAFLLDQKRFNKLKSEHRQLIKDAAAKHFSALLSDTRKSNEDALKVLKDNGITMVPTDPKALAELYAVRDKTVERVKGDAFSTRIYDAAIKILAEHRDR